MSEDIFRLAEKKDAPEFLELLYSAFQPIRNLEIDWPSARADIDMVTENIENHSAVVLERDGRLLSTITIRFPWESDTPPSKYPFVWWFATLPELKGQGIGEILLTYVEEHVAGYAEGPGHHARHFGAQASLACGYVQTEGV